MKAHYKRYVLKFRCPGVTSRGVLREKETWFLFLTDGNKTGVGECGLFRGLSSEDQPDYEDQLKFLCQRINQNEMLSVESLQYFPSIQMGYETALLSLKSEDPFQLFPSPFTRGVDKIPINGLVWMGDRSYMKAQIEEKIAQGFDCIKLKIGALDFNEEYSLLEEIRNNYSTEKIMLRVDANGAFALEGVMDKLQSLSNLEIHSIEQPIASGQAEAMRELCINSPIPIALDEELIGSLKKKKELLC